MIRTVNSIVRFTARFLVFLFAGIATLVVALIAATQIESIRAWGLEKGLAAVNDILAAKVEVGSISGNFLTGMTLHDVKLHAAGTTIVEAPIIDLHYQLSPIFNDKVIGVEVTLERPVIRLIRNADDSTWNIAHITKPVKVDDTTVTPFPYAINLHALEIRDAHFVLQDLTGPDEFDTVARSINYGYLDLQKFDLSARASFEPTKQLVLLQHVSFEMPRHEIRVIELSGNIALDTGGAAIRDLRLETDRTLLQLSARVDSVNFFSTLFDVQRLDSTPLHLTIDAPRVSTLELKRFIPETGLLGGTPSLKLETKGTFGDIRIQELTLGLTQSRLALTGRLKNILNSDSLYIEGRLADSRLHYDDTRIYIPGIPLPDLRYLGLVNVRLAEFKGYTEAFHTAIDATTAVGSVRGGAWLDLRQNVMRYDADIALVDADLAPIIGDQQYRSNFNGRAILKGEGTSLPELNTSFLLESESSTLMGRSYRKLIACGSYRDNGFIAVDTVLAAWGPVGAPARGTILESAPGSIGEFIGRNIGAIINSCGSPGDYRSIFASNPSLTAGGWLDLRNPKLPKYQISALGNRVSLSDIMPDQTSGRFSFSLTGSGSSFEPDDIQAVLELKVTEAQLPDGRSFKPFTAKVRLEQESEKNRVLNLESTLADVNLSGEWDFSTITDGVVSGINGIVDYASRKASYQDENIFAAPRRDGSGENVNAKYSLNIKDLAPLSIFLDGAELSARGELHGEIRGTSQFFSMSANGDIEEFIYKAEDLTFKLLATTIQIDMQNIVPGLIDDFTSIDIKITSDSLAQYNDMTFSTPVIEARLEDGAFKVHGATVINNEITVGLDGVVDTRDPKGYRIAVDTLLVRMPNMMSSNPAQRSAERMEIRNVGRIEALVGENEIVIDSMALQRNRAEIVRVRGSLSNGERFDSIEVVVDRASIPGLADIFAGTSTYDMLAETEGKISEFRVVLNGTLEDPTIVGRIRIDSVSHKGSPLGNIMTAINYSNQNLTGRVTVLDFGHAIDDTSHLAARIDINSFPIDLALASRDERIIKGRPVDIVAKTDSLPLAFAAPFTPGVDLRGGVANINFEVKGTVDNLSYIGNGEIVKGVAILEATNILYYIDGKFDFDGKELKVPTMTLRNDPRDLRGGMATIAGRLGFDGFTPSDFRFLIETEDEGFLALSQATQAVSPTLYGDLVIATKDLELKGTLDKPTIRGTIKALRGNLTVEQNDASESISSQVEYVDFAEWQEQTRPDAPYGPPDPNAPARPTASVDTTNKQPDVKPGSLEEQSLTLEERIKRVKKEVIGDGPGFYDLLDMRLGIEIRQGVYLTMDLGGPLQQLRAELSTNDLSTFKRDGLELKKSPYGELELNGVVKVEQGSKFVFFKSFDASGTLDFKGPIDNAKLGIQADFNGRRLQGSDVLQEYKVTITISGTVKEPRLDLTYSIDGVPAPTEQDTRQRNAISLLLFGRLTDELAGTRINDQASDLVGSALESSTSTVASGLLSDILVGNTEFIRSVEIDLAGIAPGDIGQAKVNLVSQFGKILIRYGGKISDPANDGTVTVELPLDVITNINELRNLVLQLERDAQSGGGVGSGANTKESETYRIRLQYRILW